MASKLDSFVADCRKALTSQPGTPGREQVRELVKQILKEVAEKHGVTVKDIKSKCRKLCCIRPRHEAAYRIRMEQGLSFPQIGRVLGFRDHTTILHGIKRYAKKLGAH